MNKKTKAIEKQEAILETVYNLILDPTTSEEERVLLLDYKNHIEKGKDADKELMLLAEGLRALAVKRLPDHECLSPDVASFYKTIASQGLARRELARGLMAVPITFDFGPF